MIVRNLRLERGWSQEQLAQMSGLNIRTIQRIESGQKAGLESLKSLAAVFEVELSELNPQQEPTMNDVSLTPTAEPQASVSESTNANTSPQTTGYDAKRERAKVLILGARFLLIIFMMFGINLLTSPDRIWAWWPALGLCIAFAFRCVDKLVIDPLKEQMKSK